VTSLALRDNTPIMIRPIRPDDEPAMVRFHETLSERTVHLRYFAPLKLSRRVAHDRLTRIVFTDYDREMVMVVERLGVRPENREILGVGRLSKQPGPPKARRGGGVRPAHQRPVAAPRPRIAVALAPAEGGA
jgi:acetyltransferase